MKLAYPVRIEADGNGFLARFPGVVGAHTGGATRTEALENAADALVVALAAYVKAAEALPSPRRPRRDEILVAVPPLQAAKLALYAALRDAGISNVALAKKLGVTEGAVRRLLNFNHRSHIGQIDAALAAIGKQLVVDVADAA
jgi:antitoxin HicB